MQPPTIYQKKRKIQNDSKDGYYDTELFRRNKSDIVIIIDKDEIRDTFTFSNKDERKRNKYNQYVGIPVVCDKNNGSKMVGLLELACLDDTSLASTEDEIQEIVSKYVVPYTSLLLLLHKMEKALMAKPAKQEQGNLVYGKE